MTENWQTILNILLSISTIYFGYKSMTRNCQKDNIEDINERAEMRVSLRTIDNKLDDIQKNIRNSNSDLRTLTERVIVLEQSVKQAHKRLDNMKGEDHGGTE